VEQLDGLWAAVTPADIGLECRSFLTSGFDPDAPRLNRPPARPRANCSDYSLFGRPLNSICKAIFTDFDDVVDWGIVPPVNR
jgi:hypothetical protein